MPELPEVETVKRGLQKLLIKKVIKNVNFNWPKGFIATKSDIKNHLINASVVNVRRRAKMLIIDLSTSYSLVVHLKMTGQMVFRGKQNFGAGHPSASLLGELPDKSTRVIFDLDGGDHLFFNDSRKFGWIKLLSTLQVNDNDLFKLIGPEPLEDNFTEEVFKGRLLRRKKTSIKAAILDQTVLAGVGNIYADEALFTAGINPVTKVEKLNDDKISKLYQAILEVLTLGVQKGGSTDRNYVDAEGKRGSYLDFAKVFRKQGKPCPVCGTIILKVRVAGRGTHICPKCQKVVL